MTTVQQLVAQKGRCVLSVRPEDTVYDAIKKMAEKDVGSLVVLKEGRLIGIITERHNAQLAARTTAARRDRGDHQGIGT